MDPGHEPGREPEPGLLDVAVLDDHDLLAGGVADGVAAARAAAQRWARLVELHGRRASNHQARRVNDPHATLTPRAEVVTEVIHAWGWTESQARTQLNQALFVHARLRRVWELAGTGQLPHPMAAMIADAVRHQVSDPVLVAEVADRIAGYLDRHLRDAHGMPGLPPVVACTSKQLRNKLDYELRRLRPVAAEERFARAHAARRVRATEFEDGMGQVAITGRVDEVRLAEHRLTHAAHQLRQGGDDRSVAQLRADLALDLLIGRRDPSTAEPVPVPAYARPVIAVTVPIQTLLGVADEPGTLSGGSVVPAGLTRIIATAPGSTWWRMLTDPAGRAVEVSTTGYRPTEPIWRQVALTWGSCFEPACTAPATTADLDHRVRFPEGPTATGNLWPACGRGHAAKHATGFGITTTADGRFRFTTPAGFSHPVEPPEHPATDQWPDWPDLTQPGDPGIQLTAAEVLEALGEIRHHRDQHTTQAIDDLALRWEHHQLVEAFLDDPPDETD